MSFKTKPVVKLLEGKTLQLIEPLSFQNESATTSLIVVPKGYVIVPNTAYKLDKILAVRILYCYMCDVSYYPEVREHHFKEALRSLELNWFSYKRAYFSVKLRAFLRGRK